MKGLIIEDEVVLTQSVGRVLDQEGYRCGYAATYTQAEEKIELYTYDIILVDITLPDGNGLDILDRLKQLHPETGVLILSAKDSLDDKVYGLEAGADDDLTKPFHLAELNAQIKSLIRRRFFRGNKKLQFQEITIDPDSNVIQVQERAVPLNKKEFDLLLQIYEATNRLSRLNQQLLLLAKIENRQFEDVAAVSLPRLIEHERSWLSELAEPEKLFERFVHQKAGHPSTGLGLAIVKK